MLSHFEPESKGDILVVDDVLENVQLLSTLLTQQGYDVRRVINGKMALDVANIDPPELILLDIMMPDMDGYEVCKFLKASEKTCEIPVIFLSALDEVLDKVKAFQVGGVDYINKPLQAEEVIARVENQLLIVRQQKQLRQQNEQLAAEIREKQLAEAALRDNAERERAMVTVMQRMRQSLDLNVIFNATTQELRQVLKCDRVVIYQFKLDWGGEFVSESVTPGWTSLIQRQMDEPTLNQEIITPENCRVNILKITQSLAKKTDYYLQQTPRDRDCQDIPYFCVTDIYQADFSPCYLEILEQFQARAYLALPIYCGEQLWGLLASYQNASPRHWQNTEITITRQVSEQLGIAIQQAELLATTQKQSIELKKSKEAADAANRAKSEFLANMSHELRTPLNAILGFTQIMSRDEALSTEHQQNLSIINRAGEHLLALINDILEMSKIEAGRVTLKATDIDLFFLLDTLEEMFQLKASNKGLTIAFERDLEVPQYIKIDENKLRQILINLLGNAIKFTQEGGVILRVKFKADSLLKNPPQASEVDPVASASQSPAIHHLYFEIEDTGPGILPAEMPRLFEAFGQTETGHQSQQSTGLGLPISKKFVELMGGNLTVKSQVNQGSIFSFDVKIESIEATQVQAKKLSRKVIGLQPGQPEYRILVVEDRFENRLLLVKLLTSLGFQVRDAKNGQEAMEIWQTWEPHLIWMDMQMPIMDGYEATRQIKSHVKGKKTVIIALTASAFEEQRHLMLSVGCDDFLGKPFQENILLEKMAQHLGVCYLYQEPKTTSITENSTQGLLSEQPLAADLLQMSSEWVTQLYKAAEECSLDMVLELTEQIPQTYERLATYLRNFADNFRFDQILHLIHQSTPPSK